MQKGDFHPGHDGRFLLTVTFHPLVDEAVQQRSAVVAEGGTAVGVDLELVLASGILQKSGKEICSWTNETIHGATHANYVLQ